MLFGLITTKKEKAGIEAARIEAENARNDRRQLELGQTLFTRLSTAASQNTVFNQFSDGRKSQAVGPMRVDQIKDNGGSYTVLVSIDDPNCFSFGGINTTGHPVVQVNVKAKKDILHVFYCPYGPDRNHPLSSFDSTVNELAQVVKDYRLFR